MAVGKKPDFPPLLGPGRHNMTLVEVKSLCRDPFRGNAKRNHLYQKFEEFFQEFLISGIVGEVWLNGSFLTAKDNPGDVDATVMIGAEVEPGLTLAQIDLIDRANNGFFLPEVDAFVWIWLPKDHIDFNDEYANPALTWHEQYGVENSAEWLKGFAVLRLR